MTYPHFEGDSELYWADRQPRLLDFTRHRVAAIANLVAAAVMEILGPAMWAFLIVLFVHAELTRSLIQ